MATAKERDPWQHFACNYFWGKQVLIQVPLEGSFLQASSFLYYEFCIYEAVLKMRNCIHFWDYYRIVRNHKVFLFVCFLFH